MSEFTVKWGRFGFNEGADETIERLVFFGNPDTVLLFNNTSGLPGTTSLKCQQSGLLSATHLWCNDNERFADIEAFAQAFNFPLGNETQGELCWDLTNHQLVQLLKEPTEGPAINYSPAIRAKFYNPQSGDVDDSPYERLSTHYAKFYGLDLCTCDDYWWFREYRYCIDPQGWVVLLPDEIRNRE